MIIEKRLTISKKYNSFVWLPSKTGSNTLSWILSFFEFDMFKIIDGKLILSYEGLTHFGHETHLPPEHEKLTFICSLRNPYERFFSFFKLSCRNRPELLTEENFRKFLDYEFYNVNSTIHKSKNIFESRIPDYLVRTENLYSDLIKIPFIRESKLHKSGILEDMCNMKKNKGLDLNSDEYLPNEYRELIYKEYQKHFILGGYSK